MSGTGITVSDFKKFMGKNLLTFETHLKYSLKKHRQFQDESQFYSQTHPMQWVLAGFSWQQTPEGIPYWEHVSNDWRNLVKNSLERPALPNRNVILRKTANA